MAREKSTKKFDGRKLSVAEVNALYKLAKSRLDVPASTFSPVDILNLIKTIDEG
jgi:hypothetical protein